MSTEKTKQTVQTTGHAWDGDIQEFNNPLPSWWLWGFYATVVFALVYWVLYPAWPLGNDFTKGAMNDITYKTADGKEVTTHWNTRSLLMKEMQDAREAQARYVDEIKTASYADIKASDEKNAFVYSKAKVLFADNCAACHQTGGDGVMGAYPNLLDDDWLWGGSFAQIEKTIADGRNGAMPGFKKSLTAKQISDVSDYVLGLSGHKVDATAAKRGKAVFTGAGGCFACHGADAKGKPAMGSANLTDSIWTIADVSGADELAAKKSVVAELIRDGKTRVMPGWKGRLNDTEIKILSFYVHELGGGK